MSGHTISGVASGCRLNSIHIVVNEVVLNHQLHDWHCVSSTSEGEPSHPARHLQQQTLGHAYGVDLDRTAFNL